MYTVTALFDITVPFFVFAPPPPNETTFRRPWFVVVIIDELLDFVDVHVECDDLASSSPGA